MVDNDFQMKNKAHVRANLWHIIGTLEGYATALECANESCQLEKLTDGLRSCAEVLQNLSLEVFEDEQV